MRDDAVRIVLFSENNSKLGAPFLDLLAHSPDVDLAAVVTSPEGVHCSYFVDDTHQVDLHSAAEALGIPVHRPQRVNDPEMIATLRELRPDYFTVGNFQQILKADLLSIPRVTSVNFHPSPLPRYAGLAPFFWMVVEGEHGGAVTALEVDAGVDTGAILMQRETRLTGTETALHLRSIQERANVEMLRDLIPQLRDEEFARTPQSAEHRSYFGRPGREDYRIDFGASADHVCRVVRAGYRHPGAFGELAGGTSLVVLRAAVHPDIGLPDKPGVVQHTPSGHVLVGSGRGRVRIVAVEHEGNEVRGARIAELLPEGSSFTDAMSGRVEALR